jgi:hypothetical protein
VEASTVQAIKDIAGAIKVLHPKQATGGDGMSYRNIQQNVK